MGKRKRGMEKEEIKGRENEKIKHENIIMKKLACMQDAHGLLIVPLWVRLNTYTRLFPDGGHFIPQVRGWSLLSADCFEAGPIGHASFLRPDKGGHRTPFIALLINTSDHAKMEYSDLPHSTRFCLKAYYGDPSSCKQCRPPPY